MSTFSFENGISVVFEIQFCFTTGRVPIARGFVSAALAPPLMAYNLATSDEGPRSEPFPWPIVSPGASRSL